MPGNPAMGAGMPLPLFAVAMMLVLGWVLGSFFAMLVARMPLRATGQTQPPGLTLLHPRRSACPGCGALIPWYRNIPVITYLLQRGRGACCGHPIGARTLLLELLTPLLLAGWQISSPFILLGLGVAGWPLWAGMLLGHAWLGWALVWAFAGLAGRRPWRAFMALGLVLLVLTALLLAGVMAR